MHKQSVALLTLLVCLNAAAGYQRVYPSPRVILGRQVAHFNLTFYCTLFVDFPSDEGTALCGCIVVAPDVAISAAHCFQKGTNEKQLFSAAHVRLYGQLHQVNIKLTRLLNTGVYVHPGYSGRTLADDIAVFHLPVASMTTTTFVHVNEHANSWDRLGPNDRLNVVGIGTTEKGLLSMEYDTKGRITPLSLGLPRVAPLSRRSCSNPIGFGQLNGWMSSIHLGDICAGPFNACEDKRCADSCNGDSGGPLYRRAEDSPNGEVTLFGIVSRGYRNCGVVGGYPGIYSPVHKHLNFIANVRKEQETAFPNLSVDNAQSAAVTWNMLTSMLLTTSITALLIVLPF